MVLNPDCVRDVMLTIESCDFGEHLSLKKLHNKLPQYNETDLWYTVLKLEDGGLVDAMILPPMRGETMPAIKSIEDLTYDGHEFLNTIRGSDVWSKTKDIAKNAGVFSLKAMVDIATTVAAALINKSLQGGI